ncbi:hypothetical protein AYJ05_03450 [Corynebacterium stationis]|uniref:ATP-binding protein n=1 Tax=Corynebacterium stationis TaxID=1705 RepID=A0A177ID03_9CORY|nr:hypothetical protein AYJ05_03450 [Corynebacterium stationis]
MIFPIDLPDGANKGRVSAYKVWTQAVEKWKSLNASRKEIQFTYIGEHELGSLLTEGDNSGRLKYWLEQEILSPAQQREHIEDIIAKAGPRYSPALNVDVKALQSLEAIGRTEYYFLRWRQILTALRSAKPQSWSAPYPEETSFVEAVTSCKRAMASVDQGICGLLNSSLENLELSVLEAYVDSAIESVDLVQESLYSHTTSSAGHFVGNAAILYTYTQKSIQALWDAQTLLESNDTKAAKDGELLILGDAGVGKTHLLCDVAANRISEGRPTLIALGQNFDSSMPIDQIPNRLGLEGSIDDVLKLLQAAGEATGYTSLLMIDAVNESREPRHWVDSIRVLRRKAKRHPKVGVVFACRTTYFEDTVEDSDIATAMHLGFEESTEEAVYRFSDFYEIESPTFPIFNPDFGNPLFLRLLCEAIRNSGERRFPVGPTGLSRIFRSFSESVNKKLSKSERCDYYEKDNLVQSTIEQLSRINSEHFHRDEIERITTNLLPVHHPWSSTLFKGLLDEGILIEIDNNQFAFGYQRLGDIARAQKLSSLSKKELGMRLSKLENENFQALGTLSALAIILPESHQVELIDLANENGIRLPSVIDHFIEGLSFREASSISHRTIEIVCELLEDRRWSRKLLNQLIRLACIPNHPLNANWLHTHLSGQDLAHRDSTWSSWLFGALDSEQPSPIRILIQWAWPIEKEKQVNADHESAYLSMLVLGWCLSTSDRYVRDQATKALVSIGERFPNAFVEALSLLLEVNDPYVVERIVGAACGISHRNPSSETIQGISETVAGYFTETGTTHLLTRDYLTRIFKAANQHGWTSSAPKVTGEERLTLKATPRVEIEKLTSDPNFLYNSIWRSLDGLGDFNKYVLRPALRNFVFPDAAQMMELAPRMLFDHVRELGWTPETFDLIDSKIHRSTSNSSIERIGKKYQWIALYELLGRLTDNFKLSSIYGSVPSEEFEIAEQVIRRDIDVTLLARKPIQSAYSTWHSPVQGQFPPGPSSGYPSSMDGVPDPIDLICLTDHKEQKWVKLLSYPHWEQEVLPEWVSSEPPTRYMWMNIHSYLVPSNSYEELQGWAEEKDWQGGWMPDIAEPSNLLLGAHPCDPQWSGASGALDDWDMKLTRGLPVDIFQCGALYLGTGGSRDSSSAGESQAFVPSKKVMDTLNLDHGVDFIWTDSDGIAVWDPSVGTGGTGSLVIRRDLLQKLDQAGFSIFWTVLIGHELRHHDDRLFPEPYQWVSASASYALYRGRIQKISSHAMLNSSDSESKFPIQWIPKSHEDEISI